MSYPHRLLRLLADQRGIAMVMALIGLLVLSALVMAFSMMAATEPPIANNQRRATAARAVAEAGLERVIWALNNPAADTLNHEPPTAFPTPAAFPYNNDAAVPVAVGTAVQGVFRVTVTPEPLFPSDPWQVRVDSVGWVPTDDPGDTRTKAHQRITGTLMKLRNIALDAPCALCVRGGLRISGTSVVNARDDTSCGEKAGSFATGLTSIGNSLTVATGSGQVLGANGLTSDGNVRGNDPAGNFDVIEPTTAPASGVLDPTLVAEFEESFDHFKLKEYEMNALRTLAKANGTYYQGAVTFNSSNPMPNGIVFVDTTTGQDITPDTPVGAFANVAIHGNPGSVDPSTGETNVFNGWLVVQGTLSISGNIKLNGLVYAANDLSYSGTGNGQIKGQVISANVRDVIATEIYDTTTSGNSAIQLNCNYVRNGGSGTGTLPRTWFMQAGKYRERAGP